MQAVYINENDNVNTGQTYKIYLPATEKNSDTLIYTSIQKHEWQYDGMFQR